MKRLVIKVGSSLVTNNGCGIDRARLDSWAGQIATLKKKGYRVVLVSSGAIAEGIQQLNWQQRPKKINELQAAAAIGQMGLAQIYQEIFKVHDLTTAQILLTHEDVRNRTRYLNARTTLKTLLEYDVVPIVNENDTVVIKEIKLGDNDTLGALVANLIDADHYIILTDQAGLYDQDPRHHSDAKLIHEISVEDENLDTMAGGSGSMIGTGGMLTKVKAARRAASSGTDTFIALGTIADVLVKIIDGEKIGTHFLPTETNLNAKEQWMMNQLIPSGVILLDQGAVSALQTHQKSLLPIGCVKVSGNFNRGDVVSLQDEKNNEIARGLVNYSHLEVAHILGCNSHEIATKLGYSFEEELVHRDNMAFVE